MVRFIFRRLLQMIPVLIIISIMIFGIIKLTPGDPVGTKIGPKASVEQKQAERHRLGLDKPIPVQYVKWLGRVVTGDLGTSTLHSGAPVGQVITPFLWNTFKLNIIVLILAFLISVPIGIKSAIKENSTYDNLWNIFSLAGVSMPSFFFGLILIYVFAVKLSWFPINGMVDVGSTATGLERGKQIIYHMILPVTVLTMLSMAGLIKFVRNAVLEVINQDYVRTARAKGLNEKVVIYKHAFRNALIPIVTILGMQIAGLFGGAILLESVFIWPGIGRLFLDSISSRDYNVMMAIMMLYAALVLIGNLLSDVFYAIVDPRVSVD